MSGVNVSRDRNDPIVYFEVDDLVKDLATISDLPPEQITENIFEDLGQQIATKAQQLAPRKTGALAQSIKHTVVKGVQLEVGSDLEYAMFQEFGTATRGEFPGQPYKIRPKKPGGKLVFKIGNKTIRTKEVNHPGIPARPYIRPAALEVMEPMLEKLSERGQAFIVKGPKANF